MRRGKYLVSGFGLHARNAIYYPAFRRVLDEDFVEHLFRAINWMMAWEFLATYKTLLTVRSVLLSEEPIVVRAPRFEPFGMLSAAFKIAVFGATRMIVIETVSHTPSQFSRRLQNVHLHPLG